MKKSTFIDRDGTSFRIEGYQLDSLDKLDSIQVISILGKNSK
jgi:hypothetical protein